MSGRNGQPDKPFLGIVDEHAPVQAVYIGAKVNGEMVTQKRAGQLDYSSWVVRPGQLLFVSTEGFTNTPEVVANLKDYNPADPQNTHQPALWPFGVAHDSVLDGKLACENPASVAGISAIVSGCVTIQAHVNGAKVGDTLFVALEKDRTVSVNSSSRQLRRVKVGSAHYHHQPHFLGCEFTTKPKSNSSGTMCRIGTIVEVHGQDYGVLRVLLDIQGFRSMKAPQGLQHTSMYSDMTPHPTVAPQHPVYISVKAHPTAQHRWREGYFCKRAANQSDEDIIRAECLSGADQARSGVHPTLGYSVAELTKSIGVAADTVSSHAKDDAQGIHAAMAVGGCVSVLMDHNFQVGSFLRMSGPNHGGRVINNFGNGEHYVLLNSHPYDKDNNQDKNVWTVGTNATFAQDDGKGNSFSKQPSQSAAAPVVPSFSHKAKRPRK